MAGWRKYKIAFIGCLCALLGAFVSTAQAEEIQHDFSTFGLSGSLIKTMTSTTASTDLVNYTCYKKATFTSSGGYIVLQMNSSNDSVTTDKVIEDWYRIQLTYSSAKTLTGSDIGIYIREANGAWEEVSAGVKYTSLTIDAELPYKGDFFLKIRNKNGTDFDIRRITYYVENCNCFKLVEN